MKTKVLILVLLIVAGMAATSCASSKSSRNGCSASSRFMGYR